MAHSMIFHVRVLTDGGTGMVSTDGASHARPIAQPIARNSCKNDYGCYGLSTLFVTTSRSGRRPKAGVVGRDTLGRVSHHRISHDSLARVCLCPRSALARSRPAVQPLAVRFCASLRSLWLCVGDPRQPTRSSVPLAKISSTSNGFCRMPCSTLYWMTASISRRFGAMP